MPEPTPNLVIEKQNEADDGSSRILADSRPQTPLGKETTDDEAIEEGKPAATDDEPPSEKAVDLAPIYSSFTTGEKRAIVFGASIGVFFSPLSAQIYFPALDAIASDLDITVTQVNLTVTTYMIVQAFAPMFIGSLADTAGRRPSYILCFIIYTGANIGCALVPNYGGLLALRALQSAGSSATVALSQAVVSDIVTSAERGSYVAWGSLPIVLAPSLGPVLGGIISQYLGWRWIFWFLTILSGTVTVLFLFFLPETCRLIVGDGSIRPPTLWRTFWQLTKDAYRKRKSTTPTQHDASSIADKKTTRIQRPDFTKTLSILFEKEMFILLMYGSIVYAGFYAVVTCLSNEFAKNYGFDGLKIGLVFLPIGVGSIISAFTMGKLTNWNYRRHCKKQNIPYDRARQQNMDGFPIERARLEPGIPFLVLYVLTIIGWGWSLQYKAHLAVELVLLFFVGLAVTGFSNLLSTIIVDINPGVAGSATAANNLTRCLVGAGATAAINPLIDAVGAGWAFTIIALLFAALSPCLWLILKKGVDWRREKAEKEIKRREAKDEVKVLRE
ncbi:MFS general substrate transporter [Xylariaceae sp. FL1019]|nr:MFS general substrate transporter [Xylariaceae sp. FL1019]